MNIKDYMSKEIVRLLTAFAVGVVLTIFLYPTASIAAKAYEEAKTEFDKQVITVTQKAETELTKMQKQYDETISVMKTENEKKETQMKEKIASLNSEISTMSKKIHTEIVRITRPDGTVEEHIITDTSEDSMTQRIAEMQKQYEEQSKQEVAKIQEESVKKQEQIKLETQKTVASLENKIERQTQEIETLKKKESVTIYNQKPLGIEVGMVSDLKYRFGVNYTVWGPVYVGLQVDTDMKSVRPGLTLGVRL